MVGLSINSNVAEWLGAGKVNGKNDSHNVSKLHMKHAKKFAANANLELSLSCVQTQLTPYTELEEKELMHFLEKAVQEEKFYIV
ncbi:hypothetical protein Bca52824_011200 [Brassica carinata]|uniref:Uncharacterized protein n=1 Tax=Brassica carinata TaxID=52824 RepID=A0A8X7WFU5_BRACI|nr:hypothetical protein Bca52824_011200 [Brassica carinata]